MSSLLLIRHAETALAGTFCGHTDPPLNERGRAQAAALVRKLDGTSIDAIYTSDLRRACETAQALAGPRGLRAQPQSALREIHFGQWEALRWAQIETLDPAFAALWIKEFPAIAAPGGESIAQFENRVLGAVRDLAGELLASPRRRIAIVTHAGVLRLVLERLCGVAPEAAWERSRAYCSVIPLEVPDGVIAGTSAIRVHWKPR